MGMKRFATISFFAAAALAGCAKLGSEAVENTPSEEQAEKTPFIIKVNTPVPTPKPSATKTTFNEETYEVNWSAGDALAVRINSSETPYEFVNETGETNEFTCADFHPEEGVEYEYDILYPYSTDGVYTLAGGVKTPMYGKAIAVGGNQPNVKLQQLSGIIKVTVKNDNAVGTATLTDIKIERMDGGILGGKHTYDRTTGQSEPTDAAVTYTLVGGQSKKVPAGESIAMCLQCAPFTATAGTSLKITYKVNGIEYTETKTFQKDIEFATGKVNYTTVSFKEETLGKVIKIDFGKKTTVGWNNISDVSAENVELKNTNSELTGITLSMGTGWSLADPISDEVDSYVVYGDVQYPRSVWYDGVYFNGSQVNNAWVEGRVDGPKPIYFNGLSQEKKYRFTIASYRWNATPEFRTTEIYLKGGSTTESQELRQGTAKTLASTDGHFAVFELSPDSDGKIILYANAISSSKASEARISAIIIEEI